MPEVASISAALDRALAETGVPGAVAVVVTRDGTVHESAHGLRAKGGEQPMTTDSVFRIFSMTKAIGSAAAMKLVEEGRIDLDAPVTDYLPEFAEVQVLDGWDGDAPRLRAPRTACTVRHLATHTSGMTYDVWNAAQAKYMEALGKPPTLGGTRASLFSYPMQFDPGTAWAYGMSTDWLGRVVEEVSGERIDAFLEREIFGPLGMTSTDVEFSPDMTARKVAVHASTPEGFQVIDLDLPSHPEFYGMGHALNGTGPDYARFCRMILRGGEFDGRRVFAEETVAAMCANAIGDLRLTSQPTQKAHLGLDIDIFPDVEKTHTLAFMRVEGDVEGRRRAGSVGWAGLLNTHFWIDPASDVAGVVMMQHIPFIDAPAMKVYDAFERAVYAAR
mgnify:CR=1 FL=1